MGKLLHIKDRIGLFDTAFNTALIMGAEHAYRYTWFSKTHRNVIYLWKSNIVTLF